MGNCVGTETELPIEMKSGVFVKEPFKPIMPVRHSPAIRDSNRILKSFMTSPNSTPEPKPVLEQPIIPTIIPDAVQMSEPPVNSVAVRISVEELFGYKLPDSPTPQHSMTILDMLKISTRPALALVHLEQLPTHPDIIMPNQWREVKGDLEEGKCYVYLQSKQIFIDPGDGLMMSKYIHPGTKKALNYVPDNEYILCVGYADKGRYIDCQIGLTGKAGYKEMISNAAVREVKEELSLTCKPKCIWSFWYEKAWYNWFLSEIKDCEPICDSTCVKMRDNVHQRIAVLVHGSLHDIALKLKECKFISKCSDTAAYIGILPVTYARACVKEINKSKQK